MGKNTNLVFNITKVIETIAIDKKWAFTAISVISVAIIGLNMFFLGSALVGFVFSTIFFIVNSIFLGKLLARIVKAEDWLIPLFGSLMLLLLVGFVGGLSIFLVGLQRLTITSILLAISIVSSLFVHIGKSSRGGKTEPIPSVKLNSTENKAAILLGVVVCIVVIAGLVLLFSARDYERSTVWGAIITSQYFAPYIAIYALTTFIVALCLFTRRHTKLVLALIILQSVLLFFYIALVCGSLYGSDPWSALGAEKALLEQRVPQSLSPTLLDVITNKGVFNWRHIAGIPVPEAFIARFSRLGNDAITVVSSGMLQADVQLINVLLVPLMWICFSALTWFQFGKYLSKNESYALLLAFAPTLFISMIGRGAISVPAGVGAIFLLFSIFLWINFIIKRSRNSLLIALFFSFAGLFFHTTYFIISLEIALMAIAISYILDKPQRSLKSWVAFGLTLAFTTIIIPLLDRIDSTHFTENFLQNPLTAFASFATWVTGGLSGTSFSPNTNFLVTGNKFVPVGLSIGINIVLWLFVIIGLLNYKKVNTKVLVLFVSLLVVTHIDNFIIWYLMEGLHPVGRYLDTIMDFSKLPLVALGIFSIIESAYNYGTKITIQSTKLFRLGKKLSVKVFIVLICVFLTTTSLIAYTNDPGAVWASKNEVDALTWINDNSQQHRYCVITEPFDLSVLEGISAANVTDGNLRVSFLNDMIKKPTPMIMEQAMQISNSSVAYFLITPGFNTTVIANESLGNPIWEAHVPDVFVYRWLRNQESSEVQVITDNQQSIFWSTESGGRGQIGIPYLKDTIGRLQTGFKSALQVNVTNGVFEYWKIKHEYTQSQDWFGKDFLSFYMTGSKQNETFTVTIFANSGDFYQANFTVNWDGWGRVVLPFYQFDTTMSKGSNTDMRNGRHDVKAIEISANVPGSWIIDRVTIDSFMR